MPYCSVRGVKLYYEVSGDGFPLVLIHANPFDRRLWVYQVAHFSTFFKVINLDVRGYGHSDKPTKPTSIAEMSEEVVAICRQEGVKQGIVGGISVGGVMALQLGLDYPDIFKALILVGCSSGPGTRYQTRIDGYLSQGIQSYHIQHLHSLVSKEFAESKQGKHLLAWFTEMDSRLNALAIAEIFNALQNRDVTQRLPEIRMPVLIVNGEYDNSLPRSREMSGKIAGAEHHVIAGAGHACCIEEPATFDAIVFDFLRKHSFVSASTDA